MNGCKNCPAYAKCTITDAGYRGSSCAALRHTYGLENDPEIVTNADRIRAMSDEELVDALMTFLVKSVENSEFSKVKVEFEEGYRDALLEELRQPVKDGDNNG